MNFVAGPTPLGVRDGDLALVFESRTSMVPLYIKAGEVFCNKWGQFKHDDMIGRPWGTRVRASPHCPPPRSLSIPLCLSALCVLASCSSSPSLRRGAGC